MRSFAAARESRQQQFNKNALPIDTQVYRDLNFSTQIDRTHKTAVQIDL